MNWFERYGIPGNYAVLLIFFSLKAFHPHVLCADEKVLLGVAAFSFLPLGYVLSIFSMWLYFTIGFPFSSLDLLRSDALQQSVPTHSELTAGSESEAEARLAVIFYGTLKGTNRDGRKEIAAWVSRRMDVLAINFTLLVASALLGAYVSLSFLFCPQLAYLLFKGCLGVSATQLALACAVVVIISTVLLASIKTITRQIRIMLEFVHTDSLNEFRS